MNIQSTGCCTISTLKTASQRHIAATLLAGLSFFSTQAQAQYYSSSYAPITPEITLTTAASGSGVGATSTQSDTVNAYQYVDTYKNYVSQTTAIRGEVTTAPTTTSTGIETDYLDTTTNWSNVSTTGINDSFSSSIAANNSYTNGGKWLTITGTFTSTADMQLALGFNATGSYIPSAPDYFGNVTAPTTLTSFYFAESTGTTLPTLSPASLLNYTSSVTYSDSKTYATSSSSLFSLAKGITTNFIALVFAGNNVSLSNFSFNGSSYRHNEGITTTPSFDVASQFIEAKTIPAIPEPATYSMLLAGFALIGVISRRTKQLKNS